MEKTIPIEVVLQDPSDPIVPTPEDNPVTPGESGTGTTETNIAVPNTGTDTNSTNGSNGVFANSAAIASIAILILTAIASIVLLTRRYHKRKISEAGMTRQEKRAMAVTSTIAVLALTILLGQLIVAGVVNPLATNAATDDTINDEVELDVDSKITIIATRTEDEDITVATVKNTSTATSHQTFGYKVTASMAENTTTANLYLDGDETSEYYIAPVSNEEKEENEENEALKSNTWGYTTEEESEDYLPIPLATDPTTIVKGYDNVDNELVDIYYTIQVDKDLPAGTYTGELKYTVVPAVEYMQDFAGLSQEEKTNLLANMIEDKQYTLKDNRDEKSYYISRLKDGNVWMTQNLDLDLDEDVTLTPANTNITANWRPSESTIGFNGNNGTRVIGWLTDNNAPYSADPGDIYYYSSGSNNTDTKYNSLAECEADRHKDCAHYSAGNYYNWSAAVASNDTSGLTESFIDAETSICPAGWRLPMSRRGQPGDPASDSGDEASITVGNEQVSIMLEYDILGTLTGCGGPSCYQFSTDGFNKIRLKPLYFTRPGTVYDGTLGSGGSAGDYLSSTIYSSDYTYGIYLVGGAFYPISRLSRSGGYTIRCLAE